MPMGFEEFEPIFGEAKTEGETMGSVPLHRFLFHVHAPDPSCLKIYVTDFRSRTWEAVRSIQQLEDMRDNIGIGGSWSEFVDYVIASIKSEDVKLVLEGPSKSDGAAYAKLVAQKSKGMPLISISLAKLVDSAASEAIANVSMELFKAFKSMQNLFVKEQERSYQLTKVISAEQEKNDSIQSQLELYSKRQKVQKMSVSNTGDVSAALTSLDTSSTNGLQNSPDSILVPFRLVYTQSDGPKTRLYFILRRICCNPVHCIWWGQILYLGKRLRDLEHLIVGVF